MYIIVAQRIEPYTSPSQWGVAVADPLVTPDLILAGRPADRLLTRRKWLGYGTAGEAMSGGPGRAFELAEEGTAGWSRRYVLGQGHADAAGRMPVEGDCGDARVTSHC